VTGTKLKTRISVPANASRGELLEIKTLISHPMESGFRRDAMGEPVPRNILEQFVCTYNGKEVFSAELYPAIAANPFLSFFIRAKQSGVLDFRWTDQHGQVTHESSSITVA
jgi:sulfur-oxidizing protein SoxZ